MDKNANTRVYINIIDIQSDLLHIEGAFVSENNSIIKAYDGKQFFEVIPTESSIIKKYVKDCSNELYGSAFSVDLPLNGDAEYSFVIYDGSNRKHDASIQFGLRVGLVHWIPRTYIVRSNYLIFARNNKLAVERKSLSRILHKELSYAKYLFKKKKGYLVGYRLKALIARRFKKCEVWIFSDRTTVAGDNGEALFKYVNKQNNDKIKTFFLLNENSRDFQRMKQYGEVLSVDSRKYKQKFLQADKIISSHADNWTTNAFGADAPYMRNLYDFDFVFLQHGITHNDQSAWLCKQNKNIRVLVTAGKQEYRSMLDKKYGYTEKEIKLTGFPRYDYLENRPLKRIAFLPTWRKELEGELNPNTGERDYDKDFKKSNYCVFFNRLINDDKIIAAMEEHGYTGDFFIHPSFANQAKDFKGNRTIKVHSETANYSELFATSNLIVTDFSSIAFDFCYLKKPIVYAQFDEDTFFADHLCDKGYFDYRRDGFGPVENEYDNIVDAIMHYIKNDCVMEQKYVDREEKFFAYIDQNNCRRVYEEILAI